MARTARKWFGKPGVHDPPTGSASAPLSTLIVYVIEELVYSVDEPVVVGLPDHVPRARKDVDFQVSAVLSVHFDVFWFEQSSLGTTAYYTNWSVYRFLPAPAR